MRTQSGFFFSSLHLSFSVGGGCLSALCTGSGNLQHRSSARYVQMFKKGKAACSSVQCSNRNTYMAYTVCENVPGCLDPLTAPHVLSDHLLHFCLHSLRPEKNYK